MTKKRRRYGESELRRNPEAQALFDPDLPFKPKTERSRKDYYREREKMLEDREDEEYA